MERNTELLKKQKLSDVRAVAANDLHSSDKDQNSTAQGTIEILKMLVANGLDPNSRSRNEEPVLHLAIKTRARDVIDFLLGRKVALDNSAALYFIQNEYDKRLNNRWTISDDEMQKQEREGASFLEWLITRGLDIDSPNRCGQSALFSAIDYGLYHLLPVLLKNTKNIDYVCYETRRTLLHIVLGNKAQTCWPPSYSRRYGTSIVKILLDRKVSPEFVDKSLNTALHLAIADCEGLNVIQMLIDHTTNLNHKNDAGETPFFIAIGGWLNWCEVRSIADCQKICRSLMIKGVDVDEGNQIGFRPLHIFAMRSSLDRCLEEEEIELFEMLISVGCNVNAKNSHGQTPLHLAAAGKNKAVVQKLIENGASINPRDDDGATPLHLAVCNEAAAAAEIVKVLIEHGANVNAKDGKGFTPLHKAAGDNKFFSDDSARFKLLLEHGANFCAQSNKGYSVLHMNVLKDKHYSSLCSHDDEESDYELLEDISMFALFSCSGPLSVQLTFLLNHWVKLYSAQLKCRMGYPFENQCIKDGLKYYPDSKEVHKHCMKEVEILKNTFIDTNRTSIYDFLHMNVNSRRAYIHNEELDKLVHSPAQLEKKFPLYSILILSSYNETIRRKSLMKPAKIALIKMTNIHLGDLCIERIFSSLCNADLYNLIEASGIDYFR